MSDSEADGLRPLRLDEDVAGWLHEVADRHYDGDVQQAMNECIRALMAAEAAPADPWAAVTWRAQSRSAARNAPEPHHRQGQTR